MNKKYLLLLIAFILVIFVLSLIWIKFYLRDLHQETNKVSILYDTSPLQGVSKYTYQMDKTINIRLREMYNITDREFGICLKGHLENNTFFITDFTLSKMTIREPSKVSGSCSYDTLGKLHTHLPLGTCAFSKKDKSAFFIDGFALGGIICRDRNNKVRYVFANREWREVDD